MLGGRIVVRFFGVIGLKFVSGVMIGDDNCVKLFVFGLLCNLSVCYVVCVSVGINGYVSSVKFLV